MPSQFFPRYLPLLFVLLIVAGRSRDGGPLLTAETGDNNYAAGKQFVRENRNQDALRAFLKVIDARGVQGAPESHLEAGLIYQQEYKDYVTAIYHYGRSREQSSDRTQDARVKGLIDAALREFARSLPGQPFENQSAGLLATVESLQAENKQLRDLLPPALGARLVRSPVPGPVAPIQQAPPPHDASIRAAPPPSPANVSAPAKIHKVASGDTLTTLAQKYYSNRNRWPDILAANKTLLPSEKTPLKIGMELKIP
jgi:LysM repeat protein